MMNGVWDDIRRPPRRRAGVVDEIEGQINQQAKKGAVKESGFDLEGDGDDFAYEVVRITGESNIVRHGRKARRRDSDNLDYGEEGDDEPFDEDLIAAH